MLGRRLGFPDPGPVDESGLLWGSELGTPQKGDELAQQVEQTLNRVPLHVVGSERQISRVAWCTGGAQSYIEQAADQGYDAFISGEISESTVHIARERGIHYYAAGHHATERYGVQELGVRLSEQFGITQQFIEIDNPA